jgi:flagellar basal body-associated protein FliL
MDNKTRNIILITTSVLAIAGISYYIYSKQQEKKMAAIYKQSIEEMAQQYQIFK